MSAAGCSFADFRWFFWPVYVHFKRHLIQQEDKLSHHTVLWGDCVVQRLNGTHVGTCLITMQREWCCTKHCADLTSQLSSCTINVLLKLGDLWLFSSYCHLPQFPGSFHPSASKRGHINADSILTYLRRQAETALSQLSVECHVAPLFLPLSASAHRGLSFGCWIFHAGCICMITARCHSFLR